MGCFDVVCALTNVPIKYGEKCHLVVLRKNADWDTIVWLNNAGEGRLAIDTVFHGTYDDYGRVETAQKLTKAEQHLLNTFYDHQGNNERKYFFVCDMAWKWCQKKHKDFVPSYIKERHRFNEVMLKDYGHSSLGMVSKAEEKKEIEMARVLLAFSNACKHPFSGLGQYHQYGGDEISAIKEHLELVLARLKEVEERYADDF